MIMNRRLFIGQASLLAAASGGVLRSAWAAEPDYVFADTSFGRVRGPRRPGHQDVQGHSVRREHGRARTASCRRPNPAKWTGVRDALQYGASAPQRDPGAPRAGGATGRRDRRSAGRKRRLPGPERLDAGASTTAASGR